MTDLFDRQPQHDGTTEAHERRIVRCTKKACNARIIFLPTPNGKQMPVDADTVEAADDEYAPGRHISHFATCADPNAFRKPR